MHLLRIIKFSCICICFVFLYFIFIVAPQVRKLSELQRVRAGDGHGVRLGPGQSGRPPVHLPGPGGAGRAAGLPAGRLLLLHRQTRQRRAAQHRPALPAADPALLFPHQHPWWDGWRAGVGVNWGERWRRLIDACWWVGGSDCGLIGGWDFEFAYWWIKVWR